MGFNQWVESYRKRHPNRNNSYSELKMMYEEQKPIAEKRELVVQSERKNPSNGKGEKTFNTTCPHCFEHHTIQVYYRKKEVSCLKCNKKFVATGGLKFRTRPIKKTLFDKIREVDPDVLCLVSVPCFLILSVIAILAVGEVYERIVYTPLEREVRSQRYVLYRLWDERHQKYKSKDRLASKITKNYVEADSASDLEYILWTGTQWDRYNDDADSLSSKIFLEEKKLKQLESALPDGHNLGEYKYW